MKFKSIIAAITATLLLANTSLAQTLVSVRDDKRFANQDFSQQLFKQIPHPQAADKACKAYSLGYPCSYKRRHIFRDIVLVIESYEYHSLGFTIVPSKPVSKQQALSYARILNGGIIDISFATPHSQSRKTIQYTGCFVKGDPQPQCSAELHLIPNGKISNIIIDYYNSY